MLRSVFFNGGDSFFGAISDINLLHCSAKGAGVKQRPEQGANHLRPCQSRPAIDPPSADSAKREMGVSDDPGLSFA